MSTVIYKYHLHGEKTFLSLPTGFRILKLGICPQTDQPTIWVEQDKYAESFTDIEVFQRGTGWEYEKSDDEHYIDTTIGADEGWLVWHYFWRLQ